MAVSLEFGRGRGGCSVLLDDHAGPVRPALTLVRGEEAEPADAQVRPDRGGRLVPRVLVVDDEPAMRTLVQVNLELSDFDVIVAENGVEAVRLAAEEEPDLIVLDVMMPDMSGHEVARILRRSVASPPPIVFLSARASREDRRTGYALGALDYVTKPFDPLELGDRLRVVLRHVEEGSAERLRLERLRELERAG